MTTVLLFGEDPNDLNALRTLVRDWHPETRVQIRRDPPILSRGAQRTKRGTMAERISSFARAEEQRDSKVVVVAHRDCDQVEPAHLASATELENDLRVAGVSRPVAATPAWEIEAWWMLFPEALRQVRACWRALNIGNTNVGSIPHAKERLRRELRPTGAAARKCPEYVESDSIRIAEEIARSGLLTQRAGRAASLHAFKTKLANQIALPGPQQP